MVPAASTKAANQAVATRLNEPERKFGFRLLWRLMPGGSSPSADAGTVLAGCPPYRVGRHGFLVAADLGVWGATERKTYVRSGG